MQKCFREFIKILEENGELKRLKEPRSAYDASALIAQSKEALYMDVTGFDVPLVGGIVRDVKKVALALGCEPSEIATKVNNALRNPIPPVTVTSAACQEVVINEEDVDLTKFPIILQHEKDGGPYMGSGVQFANHEKWGPNAGMYRHMFRTKNTMGIDLNSPSDLRLYYSNANDEGRPLEMAVAVGLYPTELIAATYAAPTEVDEMGIAGALRGEPVELVQCKTIDVKVPANAEIVFECEIIPGGWMGDEGRYGEFHRVSGHVKHNPIVRVKTITHRKDPIYYTLLMADEVYGLNSPLLEGMAMEILRTARIRPAAIRAPFGSCGYFELIVALDDPIPGEGKSAIMALLSLMGVKFVTVVDKDIDIYDDEEIRWALALRVQPDQDVVIVSNLQAKHMDPTVRNELLPPGRLPTTSKMGIDATIPPDIHPVAYEKTQIFRLDEVEPV